MKNEKEYFKLFTVKDGSQVLFERQFKETEDKTQYIITCVMNFDACRAANDYGYSSEKKRDEIFETKIDQDYAQRQYDIINELINK